MVKYVWKDDGFYDRNGAPMDKPFAGFQAAYVFAVFDSTIASLLKRDWKWRGTYFEMAPLWTGKRALRW
jgi:hypothetical protein